MDNWKAKMKFTFVHEVFLLFCQKIQSNNFDIFESIIIKQGINSLRLLWLTFTNDSVIIIKLLFMFKWEAKAFVWYFTRSK